MADRRRVEEHLCLDEGFDTPAAETAVVGAGHELHNRRIEEETRPSGTSPGGGWWNGPLVG